MCRVRNERYLTVALVLIAVGGMSVWPELLGAQSREATADSPQNSRTTVVESGETTPRSNARGPTSGILVISLDEFYARSNFGLQVAAEFAESGGALAAENRQIEAELIAEEKALADQRPSMKQAEFRALADAFDVKVQQFRIAQDAKVRALGQASDIAKARFFEFAQPVLEDIMRQRDAVLVIERESAILSISTIDVTAEAIAKINAVSQSGGEEGARDGIVTED